MKWTIRQEKPGDEAAIRSVVARAFEGKPYADDNDAVIVERLRDSGSLVLSLVALVRGEIVGQVALSPARIGTSQYLCLGPLAVLQECQGRGIGTDLVGHALGVARVYGRDGVVLMGDPSYYSRFGFVRSADVSYDGDGAEYVQVLPFAAPPRGTVTFHAAFSG